MTAIVAKTPVRPEANYAVGAFVRVESKCSKAIAQRPAQDVYRREWSPAEGAQRCL
ncbi:MAG: hypothetical protein WA453_06360 [Methyloceanibacter sp.]